MTIRGWYQRMNPRERVLATIVGGTLFLLLNLYIWGKLLGMLEQARADLVARQNTRKV